MQFLRIAGDDVPKPKKKRAPKVEKVRPFLYVFCVWLPHKYYCAEVYISRKIICLKLLWKTSVFAMPSWSAESLLSFIRIVRPITA